MAGEIVEGLDGQVREQIKKLRADGHFFWIDLPVAGIDAEQLERALGIPAEASRPLLDFERGERPSRRFTASRQQVVFPFHCYIEEDGETETTPPLRAIEVNVLVHGDFLLTAHREPLSLPSLLPTYNSEGRSEQYVVYAVLDAMVATAFDALSDAELALEKLQTLTTEQSGGAKMRMGTLRAINLRLTSMRRQIGPQRGIFERIGEEIGQVENLVSDSESYFERVYGQLNRIVDGIDAAADSMAQLIDLRMNETMYWLTVVATIFLPLTFLTGFFGMNFGWLVERIDTPLAFFGLGIGGSLIAALLIWVVVRRRATPVQPDQDAFEGLLAAVRRPLSAPAAAAVKGSRLAAAKGGRFLDR
jgi:magnesium transporter